MILVVGPLPPPVHGAASVTLEVVRLLEREGVPHQPLSLSPGPRRRGAAYYLSRALACARVVHYILGGARPKKVYLAISGGWGLLYDLAIATAARVRGVPVVVHHHSFAYLTRRSRLLAGLVRVMGKSQNHVVLCRCMGRLLSTHYPRVRDASVISNGAFLAEPSLPSLRFGPLGAIGFLSNVTREKGIDRFLELVGQLRALGWDKRVVIAGPITDERLRAAVLKRCKELGNARYVGPVYGDEREGFFASIDLMVFPTRYADEAEPLVILEAQQRGVLVAASKRGCIAAMIGVPNLLLDADGQDVGKLVEQIVIWATDTSAFEMERQRLAAVVEMRKLANREMRERFVAVLKGQD